MGDKRSMFFGATPGIFSNARELRNRETAAEKLLWERLKNNKLNGFRFKRQHPILTYVADFYCHKAKLVIEIDGSYHKRKRQKNYDKYRTQIMNELGLTVIRFSNFELQENPDLVIEQISAHLFS